MKKILLGCLFSTMVSGMLLGNEYYQALDSAENYIKKNYSGSIASQQALNDLASIASSQGSHAEKIAKIKKAFPNAFIIISKEVLEYRKAAEKGDVEAQFKLGLCYERGEGIGKNLNKAVEWYQKAAVQGHAKAQCNLGWCYAKGIGVEKNLTKAVEWYQKAAEQGNVFAKEALERLKK